jgi:hypothetical protein
MALTARCDVYEGIYFECGGLLQVVLTVGEHTCASEVHRAHDGVVQFTLAGDVYERLPPLHVEGADELADNLFVSVYKRGLVGASLIGFKRFATGHVLHECARGAAAPPAWHVLSANPAVLWDGGALVEPPRLLFALHLEPFSKLTALPFEPSHVPATAAFELRATVGPLRALLPPPGLPHIVHAYHVTIELAGASRSVLVGASLAEASSDGAVRHISMPLHLPEPTHLALAPKVHLTVRAVPPASTLRKVGTAIGLPVLGIMPSERVVAHAFAPCDAACHDEARPGARERRTMRALYRDPDQAAAAAAWVDLWREASEADEAASGRGQRQPWPVGQLHCAFDLRLAER